MRTLISPLLTAVLLAAACGQTASDPVKTTFQTAGPWRPIVDTRADAVMVYGTCSGEASLEERLASWRERGYLTHFMTGIAWGAYADYFTGEWDGRPHWDEAQVEASGDTLWHGKNSPYIVPTENYLAYFKERHIKPVIDAGVDAIFLEEPEFWARAGYSEAFKREWEAFYGTPWRPRDESPEAAWRSAKLKYHLYYRALEECFTYAKEYGRSLGRKIRCYVPTHSLINYSQWQIVSPEASLASLPCVDGYIAQVWTGTSRVPNLYGGRLRSRVFETAFLEYGCMLSMTAPTGRRIWLLTDPIEDARRDWEDYRRNYHIVAVMDEGSATASPYTMNGLFVDLFDPELPVYTSKLIQAGEQGFFYEIDKAGKAPKIIATGGRSYQERREGRSFRCLVKGPAETVNVTRVLLPGQPVTITVNGSPYPFDWDEASRTCRLRFPNSPDGVAIRIRW